MVLNVPSMFRERAINRIVLDEIPTLQTMKYFVTDLLVNMKLCNEVCLLSLIFIERIIVSLVYD